MSQNTSVNALQNQERGSASLLAGDSLAAGILFALVLTVGQRAFGFLRGVLFCRLMDDQSLGQWSIVWGFLMLLPPLAMLGLPGCFGKYTEYYRQRGSAKAFVVRIAWVSGMTTAAGVLLLTLFPGYFSKLLLESDSRSLLLCLAATLIAVAVSNFAATLLESIRQVRLVSFMRFIIVFIFTILGCCATVWFEHYSVHAVTLAYGLSCLFSMFPVAWLYWRYRGSLATLDINPLPHAEMWKRILPFAGWLWISNFLTNSVEIVDRYMLLKFSAVSVEIAQGYVGQYHSSRIVPMLLTSVATMLGGVLLPYLSKLWEGGRKEDAVRQLNLSFKLVGWTFTAGGILFLALSGFFFDTILQGRYTAGLEIFPITMVLSVWFSLYTVGQDYLWVAERGRMVSIALAAGLAASIALNAILIPTWGLWGAVIGSAGGNLLLVLLILVMNGRAGCATDFGMWATVGLPLLFLLPPWGAAVSLVLISLLAWRTQWLFTEREKCLGAEMVSNFRARFGR